MGRGTWLQGKLTTVVSFVAAIAWPAFATRAMASAQDQARHLFNVLAGAPVRLDDPRLQQMVALINHGDVMGAADIAANDDGFYNITLKHFAAPMSSRNEDPTVELNDFIATVIGVARDDLDARQLLTGDFVYQADPAGVTGAIASCGGTACDVQSDAALLVNNPHYDALDRLRVNLRQTLVPVRQRGFAAAIDYPKSSASPTPLQPENGGTPASPPITLPDTAGLLTTRQWAQEHVTAGTNRRPIQYAFQEFLCVPNTETRDFTVPDSPTHIRRDVDRAPGGL